MIRYFSIFIFLLMFWLRVVPAMASTFRIIPDDSFAGVVVFKTGIGSKLAHNHFIVASNLEVTQFEIPEGQPIESGHFRASASVSNLSVDEWALSTKWRDLLRSIDVISDDVELSEIALDDRNKIKESMLSSNQLDAEKFPKLEVELLSLQKIPGKIGKVNTSHMAKIAVTIHGRRNEFEFPSVVELSTDDLNIFTVGKMAFTSFGFAPVSIAFGAIRNKDEFQMVTKIHARKVK